MQITYLARHCRVVTFTAGATADGGLTPGPRARDPGACAAAYLMRGASWAAVIELTRLRFPFGW